MVLEHEYSEEYLFSLRERFDDGRKTRYDKILGSLTAGALGDALGYSIEFSSWEQISNAYGTDGIRFLQPRKDGKAIISDDTQMTLFTCEGIIRGYARAEERDVSAPVEWYIYQSYLCWMQTQGYDRKSLWDPVSYLLTCPGLRCCRAPGITCLNALQEEEYGTPEKPINSSKGCGGVMRTAPLGYTNCCGDAMINGARTAALTHGHPGGWIPAGMLSDIIFRLVFGEPKSLDAVFLDSAKAVAARWGNMLECRAFLVLIRKAVALAASEQPDRQCIEALAANPHKGGGWTGDEALAIAILCCLRHPNDISGCLRAAVNHGGDSDSTGAIAGNILGAYLGNQSIPQDWIDSIELLPEIRAMATHMAAIGLYFRHV